MAKPKHYVVWQGREPGIYDNWAEAKAQVDGFKNARYKSFPTIEAAAEAYASGSSRSRAAPVSAHTKSKGDTHKKPQQRAQAAPGPEPATVIYCDGAASPNPGPAGTGIAIYRNGCVDELRYGLYQRQGTNNIAELNGILYALKIAQPLCLAGETVRIASDSDYSIKAISVWAYGWKTKGWRRGTNEIKNLALVQEAHALYDTLKNNIELVHVKAHSGIEGNELADRMAMYTLQQQEPTLAAYEGAVDVRAILLMKSG
ncbi:MAG: ribonuclease HI [Halieaceae bacterium]|jgi:ribonuclease HI